MNIAATKRFSVYALAAATIAASIPKAPSQPDTVPDEVNESFRLDFHTLDFDASWEDPADGVLLQRAETPGEMAPWIGIPQAPILSGERRILNFPIASAPRMFFRLRPKGIIAALDYLKATQADSGLWGSLPSLELRDGATVISSLVPYEERDTFVLPMIDRALAEITFSQSTNNDELARKIIALRDAGATSSTLTNLVDELLASQNDEISSASAQLFPGAGWGILPGYDNSALDTALALRALAPEDRSQGVTFASKSLAPGASTGARSFTLPAGSTELLLKAYSIIGGAVDFAIARPGGGIATVTLTPSAALQGVGIPNEIEGEWTVTATNNGSVPVVFSAQIAFEREDGSSAHQVGNPFIMLTKMQNLDGGWGVQSGDASQFMVTAEVIRTLGISGVVEEESEATASGTAWLNSFAKADGSFNSTPGATSGNVIETALAILALREAKAASPLADAAAFLQSQQQPDGSWENNPYSTALAIDALVLPPALSPIPNQTVGDPALFTTIDLDSFVSDPNHSDAEISWTVSGNSLITVAIGADRVVTLAGPPGQSIEETLTFLATDPTGFTAEISATFTVSQSDYTLAAGSSVSGTESFPIDPAIVSQIAGFLTQFSGFPPGLTVSIDQIQMPSGQTLQVDFTFSATSAAAPGIFLVTIELAPQDASGTTLSPPGEFLITTTVEITP